MNLRALLLLASLLLSAAGGYFFSEGRHKAAESEKAKRAISATLAAQAKVDNDEAIAAPARAAVEEKTKLVTKEVVRYVQITLPAARCQLPGTWRMRHDAAARGALPESPRLADAAAQAVDDATALEVVASNYASCREAADQVLGWQQFWGRVGPLCRGEP